MNKDHLELLNKDDFFYSYDIGMIKYLRKKGFHYISMGKHIKTGNIFAVFVKTDKLKLHIDKWNKFNN